MPGFSRIPPGNIPQATVGIRATGIVIDGAVLSFLDRNGKFRFLTQGLSANPNPAQSVLNTASTTIVVATAGFTNLITYADVTSSIAGRFDILDNATTILSLILQANVTYILPFTVLAPYLQLAVNTALTLKNSSGSTATIYTNALYSVVT